MRNLTKLHDSHAEYIDPESCGSLVGYKVSSTKYPYYSYIAASMNLSDCNRFIQWEFGFRQNKKGGYEGAVAKIDRAIAVFQKFRAALEQARPRRTRRKK